ncbi:hypothetical protein AURDEDRAFT_170569 [Auricularia subglabra TFB-10046 SS5]|nr:hypothetical protein AURDEDRAFT_170569 [Auricularia subglabra TFB-10046 SS5]
MWGAVELSVTTSVTGHDPVQITARLSGDRKVTLILHNDEASVATLLARCIAGLSGLRNLTVTSKIFHIFSMERGALPSLLELSIIVHPRYCFSMPVGFATAVPGYTGTETGYLYSFPWEQLDVFPPLPRLTSVHVEVRTTVEGTGALSVRGKTFLPTVSDARRLVDKLGAGLAAAHAVDAQITISGFLPAVLDNADLDMFLADVLDIVFL